ncbi:MAG: hypothetical protein EOM66_00165 [Clostridia bacterium]|nr:hypothetical protein [Clostridia bacterium]
MSRDMNYGEAAEPKARSFRFWLIRTIWCFGGITLVGTILGGVLFFCVTRTSGLRAQNRQDGQEVEIYSKEQIDKFITSVLIIVQNQPMGQESAQADMVFIASFNAFEQRLTMVALADETLVQTEEYGDKSLGEAYALGGPGLLVNIINQSFGLDLQNYACTDTHSLAVMIDLLGGIQTELTQNEADYINNALGNSGEGLHAGTVTLTGAQSVVHAMDNLSGQEPLGSPRRSLKLIQSLVFNLRKTATKEAMLPLLSLLFSNIETNLDFTMLHDLGYEVLKAEEMEYQSLLIPCDGSWKAAGTNGEKLQADIAQNGELLLETLYNAQ